MPQIIAKYSTVVNKLLKATTESWTSALKILFTNAVSLPRFQVIPKGDVRCIIELSSDSRNSETYPKGVYEAVQLAKQELTETLSRLDEIRIGDFVNSISPFMQEEEKIKQMVSEVPNVKKLLIELVNKMGSVLFDKTLLDGWTAVILENLIQAHNQQPKDIKNHDVIQKLCKLGLIEPRLQIGICSECINFEIIFSTFPNRPLVCTKCGRPNFSIKLYALVSEYNELKESNKLELPCFICEFIKRQSESKVKPNPLKLIAKNGIQQEVDVHISETKTGIECKLFPHAESFTEADIRSQGDLFKQLVNYSKVGIRRAIVITNLPDKWAKELQRESIERLAKESVKFDDFFVLPSSAEELLSTLKRESKMAQQVHAID